MTDPYSTQSFNKMVFIQAKETFLKLLVFNSLKI